MSFPTKNGDVHWFSMLMFVYHGVFNMLGRQEATPRRPSFRAVLMSETTWQSTWHVCFAVVGSRSLEVLIDVVDLYWIHCTKIDISFCLKSTCFTKDPAVLTSWIWASFSEASGIYIGLLGVNFVFDKSHVAGKQHEVWANPPVYQDVGIATICSDHLMISMKEFLVVRCCMGQTV